jgi:hypothetical protein
MRVGALLISLVFFLGAGIVSSTWTDSPELSTKTPVSVRIRSVPPQKIKRSGSRGGVYVGGSRSRSSSSGSGSRYRSSRSRYSSGGK